MEQLKQPNDIFAAQSLSEATAIDWALFSILALMAITAVTLVIKDIYRVKWMKVVRW